MGMIQSLTDIADEAVILPVVALAALGLLLSGQRRAALAWAIIAPGTLLAVLAAKMSITACGGLLPAEWHLHSPSGHTAAATAVYGGLIAILLRWPRWPFNALLFGSIMATLVGASRLALHVHSPADVLAGGLIGMTGAILLTAAARPTQGAFKSPLTLLGIVGITVLSLHGYHFDSENNIRLIAPTLWPLTLCRL